MSSMRFRTAAAAVLLGFLVVGRSAAATPSALSGIARDLLGHRLADAEIYLLTDAGRAAGATRTDDQGRFSFAGLLPGLYRVAGLKAGYELSVGRVNTALRSSLELLFRPSAFLVDTGAGVLPGDRSWVLRVPRRGILREEDGGAPLREGAPARPVASVPEFLAAIDGSLDQWFRFGDAGGDGVAREGGMQGSETRLRMSSPLGERAGLDLRGGHEWLGGGSGARRLAGADFSDLLVQVTLDPTDGSRVALRSFFAGRDHPAGRGALDGPGGTDRSWGWDARWSAQIDAATHVAAALNYQQASFVAPAPAPTPAADHRSVEATGRLETSAARNHRLEVAFAAARADRSEAIVSGDPSGSDRLTRGVPGFSLLVDAQDSWSLTGRTSLVYGFGLLDRPESGGGPRVLLPRLGGAVSRERIKARVVLSYLAGDQPGGRELGSLGYDAELELSLPGGLLLRSSAAYAPALSARASANDPLAAPPVYLSDGSSAARETSFGIEQAAAFGNAFLRYSAGSAEGNLAVLPVARAPFHRLGAARISFRSAQAGMRVARTGTQIATAWRRVVDQDGTRADHRPARATGELSVVQDLRLGDEGGVAWKILMVCRADRASKGDAAAGGLPFEESDLGRELRAGVSMTF